MDDEMKSVSRLVKLAKGARNLGLFILGLSIYVGVLLTIIWVLLKGVAAGKVNVTQAVAFATFATTMLHWWLYAFTA